MSPKNQLSGSRRFRVVFGVTLVSKVHSVSVVVTVVSLCTCGIQSPPVFVVAQLLHVGISFLVSTGSTVGAFSGWSSMLALSGRLAYYILLLDYLSCIMDLWICVI